MAMSASSVVASCSVCGEQLNRRGECVACLLRAALDKSAVEGAPPGSVVFGDFEIARCEDGSLRELGRGAMGVTYLAMDKVLRRKVALKVIEVPATMRRLHELHQRFLREARSAASLRHPNVAAVYQFGSLPDGRYRYYAMELVEGETLETRVRRDGPLKAKLVLEIAMQITRALMAAATHGLIHRDLKPGNIMLAPSDSAELEVKVIDFGLAKAISDAENEMDLTHGEFVGTPNFASPEQFESGPVDVRSDIYSLGATLWFALTGKTPFAGRNIEEIHSAQKSGVLPTEQLDAARVPSRLRLLLQSVLACEPAARPGVKELVARLQSYSTPATGRGIGIALAGAAILIVATALGIYLSREETLSVAKEPSGRIMLAVLPFEEASGDSEQELFSDGLTDAMISRLGRLRPEHLGVIAHSSTVQYRRAKKDVREIGRELGATCVLQGTVHRVGSKMRVSAELIQVSDQRHLFARSYERDSPDIAALPDEMAEAVSKDVAGKLNLAYQTSSVSAHRTNPEAYEAYLRGCRYFDEAEFDKSIDYFDQAIKSDPSYGPSYAKLAIAYYELAFFNMLPPKVAFERTRNAALHALEKDDTLSEAHGALAEVKLHYDLDFVGAQSEFTRALQLDPNNAAVRHDYSHYLIGMGRTAESAAETAKAVTLDPVNIDLIGCLCWHRYAAREYDQSIAWAKKAIQMAPGVDWHHLVLGWAYEQQARLPEAIDEFKKAVELSKESEYAIAALGHAYAVSGDKAALQEILDKLGKISKDGFVSAFDMAVIYTGMGNKEEAFQWLDKAYQERSSFLVYSGWEPRLDPLRSDPRFQELLYRIGLHPSNPAGPEKSIAVLPFENLSRDPDNAFFADGVQDEILTDLAQVADLKVISRTSVMQYKTGVGRNLREIGGQLGVTHVVEGSVQRAGKRVRVNAQLVDARSDQHVWGQTYDRDLADVFAIQSEIAKAIADQLRAKLSPSEKAAIEQSPTNDLAAFDLYTRANALLRRAVQSGARKANLLQAVELLNQAVARDPHFLLAYCRLVFAHDVLYLTYLDHTASRRAMGEAAVQSALRIQPYSGETHLAVARHLYAGLDYDRAKQELAIAQSMLPNSSELLELKGYVERRQGHWLESTNNLRKVLEIDPLNFFVVGQVSATYQWLRDYEQAKAVLDRVLAIAPKDVITRLLHAQIDLHWRADTKPLHATIDAILAEDPSEAAAVSNIWLNLALCERDPVAADRALVALAGDAFYAFPNAPFNRSFTEGLIASIRGDSAAAHAAFTVARVQQEEIVRTQPDNAGALSVLGLIDAGLGRKEDALREGRRALEVLPTTRDAFVAGDLIQIFSIICAWTGEKEVALQQLDKVTQIPTSLTYGRLRLLPFWHPLRGDPRFEKIVASLAPK